MKILFVNRMLSIERGGGETFDLEIARHLQQRGCQVAFLSGLPLLGRPRRSAWASNNRSRIVHFFEIRSPYFGWFPWDRTRGGWRLRIADFVMFEWRAARWVAQRQKDYDAIQACELPFFVKTIKECGVSVPVVIRLTAPNFYDPWNGIRLADAVIASGETVAQVRQSVRSDCYDVPNAVDASFFRPHPSPFREKHGISPDAFIVLYVARFQDFKNHQLLMDAFAKLVSEVPRTRLVLVGKGPLLQRTQQRARALGIGEHVLFLGEQPFECLPDIYAASDVVAISSDFESFCFAALEAMATGLPIVTTDCGWVPKLLGARVAAQELAPASDVTAHEGGIVVPCRDAARLFAGLVMLYKNRTLSKAMGQRNRGFVSAYYSWTNSANTLYKIYESLTIR